MNEEEKLKSEKLMGPTTNSDPIKDNSQEPVENPQPTTNAEPPLEVKADALKSEPLTPPTTPNTQYNNEMEVHHHGHVHEKKKWKEYFS